MIGRALLYALSAILAVWLASQVVDLVRKGLQPAAAALAGCQARDGGRCYAPEASK